jgi:lipopolysaccharide export system protein LptA
VPKNKGDLITVTSSGGAEIHQKKNLMIYLQNVKFDHPTQNMVMKCERLEVYRDDPPPPPPKPPLAQEAAQGAKPEAPQQPDLKEAIATGNVVITKKGADGGNNVGRGQKAVFNGKTRDVLLSGNPSLEVGDNLFFADTIILREDGQHRLGNNARTVFKPKKNKEKGGAGGGAQP